MKKMIFILIISLIGIGLTGCDESKTTSKTTNIQSIKEEIPEPFKRAKESLSSGDMDTALKYLELTKKDFKDSEYIYDTNIIESIIYRSKIITLVSIGNSISKGASNYSFYNEDDIKQMKKYSSSIKKELKSITPKYLGNLNYIITNYNDEKKDRENYDIYYSNDEQPVKDLSFFETVGYPVPSESDIEDYRNVISQTNLSFVISETVDNEKIDYVKYFYLMANGIYQLNTKRPDDISLRNSLLQQVLSLTALDQYNKTRLDALDLIKKK